MSEDLLLSVEHLHKQFTVGGASFLSTAGYLTAVDDVNFSMPSEPSIVTLAGESGSGKTTIARILLRLIDHTSGDIKYKGNSVFGFTGKELLNYRKKVQAILQDPYAVFNPFYKADHTLNVAMEKLGSYSSTQEKKAKIKEAVESVGLNYQEIANKYPHEFSGGQRQRVMLARILLIKPELLIGDEPISMLDASLSANILNLLLDFKKEYNLSILYITHDLSLANYISDYIILLLRGSIVEKGNITDVIQNPKHPYTKDLLASIPLPDPEKRWKDQIQLENVELIQKERADTDFHCKFFLRCPFVTELCQIQEPPMIELNDKHSVKCHLFS